MLKDFTFSNGTFVPAGYNIAAALAATHHDDVSLLDTVVKESTDTRPLKANYANAREFDGFRFAHMREGDGESIKHQMVSLTLDYITFGTGRHGW